LYNFVNMNIESYISQLLYRYQCITVPGFGAFWLKSSQHNGLKDPILFPKKAGFFNAQFKNNDGLLANHIAKEKHLTNMP
jgi:hypothetical protein